MAIYILPFAINVVLFGISFLLPRDKKWIRYVFPLISLLPMLLLSALKSTSVGTDTVAYVTAYNEALSKSISSESFGFEILMRLFRMLNLPFFVFSSFLYLTIYGGLYFLVLKKDYNAASFSLFVCGSGLFVFGLSGLRQFFCFGLSMYALAFFETGKKAKNWVLFYLFSLAGVSVHYSGGVLLIYPFLRLFTLKKSNFLPLALLLAFFLTLIPSALNFLYFDLGSITYPPSKLGTNKTLIVASFVYLFITLIYLFRTKINIKLASIAEKDEQTTVPSLVLKSPAFEEEYLSGLFLIVFLFVGVFSFIYSRMAIFYYVPFYGVVVSFQASINNRKLKLVLSLGFIVALFALFYVTTSKTGGIFPYRLLNALPFFKA